MSFLFLKVVNQKFLMYPLKMHEKTHLCEKTNAVVLITNEGRNIVFKILNSSFWKKVAIAEFQIVTWYFMIIQLRVTANFNISFSSIIILSFAGMLKSKKCYCSLALPVAEQVAAAGTCSAYLSALLQSRMKKKSKNGSHVNSKHDHIHEARKLAT